MAGKPGRSGGARPGAGRKKAVRPPADPPANSDSAKAEEPPQLSSLDYLRTVMNDPLADKSLRLRAAVTVAQYEHTKTHDGGKKEAREKAAGDVASTSRFAPALPPKLKRVA